MNPTIEDVNSVMPQLNKYAAYLFQTTRDFDDVDSLRRHTFIHKGKPFDALPPGSDALKLHTHRAAFRAGHVLGKVLVPMMNAPSPNDWGWIETPTRYVPKWTSIDVLSKKLIPLRVCGCGKRCAGQCVCTVLNIPCTGLCGCLGKCFGKPRTAAPATPAHNDPAPAAL